MLSGEQDFFIEALADHLNGRKTDMPQGVEEGLLLAICKQQQCEGIVYYQSRFPALKSQFAREAYYAVNRETLLSQIHNLLAENHIRYLIFKGSEIAQFYPVPTLRTMGDSDIMVHEEDKQKTHELLLSVGFVNECIGPNEWIYSKGNMEFEVHHRLMNEELVSLPEHEAFMKTVWEHAKTEDGIQYRLDWDYHILFLFLHLRKHFMNCGVGFRQFMDVAVVAKNAPIDWDGFQRMVEELKISDFVTTCFAFIKRWFGMDFPFPTTEIEDGFYETATRQIFDNGVFGFDDADNHENYTVIRLQKGSKIKLFLQSIFPPYKNINGVPKYAFLQGRPWLLPVAWVVRFITSMRERTVKNRMSEVQKHLQVTKEQANDRTEYLKQWGLA